MVEEGGAGLQGDRLLAGIDQVPVLLALRRRPAEAEDAVLGVADRLAALDRVGRDLFGKADTESDIGAVLDLPLIPSCCCRTLPDI